MKTLLDYCRKENPSLREEVRYLVKLGERKKDVARKLGLKYDKVISWTEDIKMRKHYPQEFKEEVRKRVKNGEKKTDVARDMGLNIPTVTLWAGNIGRDGWVTGLTEGQLATLNDILENGYTFPSDYMMPNIKKSYEKLRKYLPLRLVRIKKNSIYFLDNKKEDAFKAFTERYGGKIVSYHILVGMDKCFGITDSKKVVNIIRSIKENKKND